VAVVLAGGGQDGAGGRARVLVAQPGQGLQARGQRLIPQARGQLRLGQHQLSLAGRVPGPPGGAQDRGQGAPQPVLGRRRQWLGQHVTGGRGGLVQPPGRG
jgi:hypothetical protein